ncbi:MAG: acyl-CoA thioesterase [Gammaproteobacteria bacterium]|nr:acyl-CoA thioesterase [Gammaproteobacteria bacterium]
MQTMPISSIPEGDLVIRTIAMPKDTNFNGDIFGGWLLSQMDLGGAVAARKLSRSRIVTIAIDAMRFRNPVKVGDTICCYAQLQKIGNTSMTFKLTAWVNEGGVSDSRSCVTEALFTYVSIDEQGNKIPVFRPENPNPEDLK